MRVDFIFKPKDALSIAITAIILFSIIAVALNAMSGKFDQATSIAFLGIIIMVPIICCLIRPKE